MGARQNTWSRSVRRLGYKIREHPGAAGPSLPSDKPLMTNSSIDKNPLLEPWTGPFEAPPFERIEPSHFRPAFDAAIRQARAEIDAVAANPDPPTFANTIEALERSGRSLDKVAAVFFNLAGAATNDEIQAIEREIAPVLARHRSDTYLNDALFKRIDALKAGEARLGLSAEQARVLGRYHLDFTRAGAGQPPEAKARLAAIAERLATPWRSVRPERAGGRKRLADALRRGRSRRPAGFLRRERGAHCGRARPCRQIRRHAVALEHRALPAILVAAGFARKSLSRMGPARRERRQDRQSRRRCRNGALEGRARAAPGL